MTNQQQTAGPAAAASPAAAAGTDRVVEITRTLAAPIEAVFRAWTDPARLVQWWGPEGVTISFCEMDVREGGRWRTCMAMPDGSEIWVGGIYREIEAPNRLSFTWAWDQEDGSRGHETVVTIELAEKDGGTEMRLHQAEFQDAEVCRKHNEGWTSSFVCLDAQLAGG